jgi:hypothetical protein
MTVPSEQPFPADVLAMARGMLESTLEPDEPLDDVLSGGVHLAVRRAGLLDRRAVSTDLLKVLTIIAACKVGPPYPPDYMKQMARVRKNLFTGAAAGNFERLDKAVPDATLSLTFEAIYKLHARGNTEGFLRLPRDE